MLHDCPKRPYHNDKRSRQNDDSHQLTYPRRYYATVQDKCWTERPFLFDRREANVGRDGA